jgi:hypothetical protein
MSEVIINNRFCGPPQSGNGGYAVGLLAAELGFKAEVTLRVPPPLDKTLQIVKSNDGIQLLDGDVLVASAKSCDLQLDIPPPPNLGQALQGEKNFKCYHDHIFPTCFVCGPDRAVGDGLRLFTGTYDGATVAGTVAAPWQTDQSLLGDDGNIDPIFVVSALDCPGFFSLPHGTKALLGRMQVNVTGVLKPGEQTIVAAWPLGNEGRKFYAGSAVYNAAGQAIASAFATWISID